MAMPAPIPATRMAVWRRAAAALCIAVAAAQHPHAHAEAPTSDRNSYTPNGYGGSSSIPFGVAGVTTRVPIGANGVRDSSNGAVQPQGNTVTMDELRSMVNRGRDDSSVAIVNPFTRMPMPAAATSSGSTSGSTSTAAAALTAATAVVIETAPPPATISIPGVDGSNTVEVRVPSSDVASGSSSSSLTEAFTREVVRPNTGRNNAATPTPTPQEDDELWFESPQPSSTKKRSNAIAFDVVRPQAPPSSGSGETGGVTTPTEPRATAAPQALSPRPSPSPFPTPTVTPAAVLPIATPRASTKPATTTPTAITPEVITPAVVPAYPAATPVTPVVSSAPTSTAQNASVTPGAKTPVLSEGGGIPLQAESAPLPTAIGGGQPGVGHSSSATEESVVGHSKKGASTVGGSSSNGASTESSNSNSSSSSNSSLYSMGTASIMSIVGVIVGICLIVSLFVLISRRNYENGDDDHDVLNYGGAGGGGIKLNLDDSRSNSIVRLSPTFLMNGMAPPAPGQPMEPDFGSMSPHHQIMGSNRGRAPMTGMPEQSPAMLENYAPQQRHLAGEGGPSPSAFDSTDEFSTLDSRESDGWSSVMESDFGQRSASRCTRDTTFSSITMSQNYSDFNPADFRSGTFRSMTAPRRPGGDLEGTLRGTTKGSSLPQEYDIDEETASVMSYDVDENRHAHGARSTDALSFRMSGYSDVRPTDQSFDRSTDAYV